MDAIPQAESMFVSEGQESIVALSGRQAGQQKQIASQLGE
jgi:hypothetical protein